MELVVQEAEHQGWVFKVVLSPCPGRRGHRADPKPKEVLSQPVPTKAKLPFREPEPKLGKLIPGLGMD